MTVYRLIVISCILATQVKQSRFICMIYLYGNQQLTNRRPGNSRSVIFSRFEHLKDINLFFSKYTFFITYTGHMNKISGIWLTGRPRE